MTNNLIEFLAKSCHYAQSHIDDADAWDTSVVNREHCLQCTSFQVACFLSQNTVDGRNGVDWDIILDKLVEHPMKSEKKWQKIICNLVNELGGLKN
jgi:hypothetical protein